MNARALYEELLGHSRERAILASVTSLLAWDEETVMPRDGAVHRAEQQSLVAGLQHDMLASPRVGELLDALADSPELATPAERANLRLLRRAHDRAVKMPRSLVQELSNVTTLAQEAWRDAREANNFAQFQPWLDRTVALKRAEAAALGPAASPYDALLEEYEPGFTSAQLDVLFAELEPKLKATLALAASRRPAECLRRSVPAQRQLAFSLEVGRALGFDSLRGRLDTAVHPSTIAIGHRDVRMTTRTSDQDCTDALFCLLHEMGH